MSFDLMLAGSGICGVPRRARQKKQKPRTKIKRTNTTILTDIIVTTPKNKMQIAEEEARRCIEARGGFYFRTFRNAPRNLQIGSRIFYVEDGYIRGFGLVSEVRHSNMQCGTTGQDWGDGTHAIMLAESWKWIRPIPMSGFQGWRYFNARKIKVVGNWLDPKPKT